MDIKPNTALLTLIGQLHETLLPWKEQARSRFNQRAEAMLQTLNEKQISIIERYKQDPESRGFISGLIVSNYSAYDKRTPIQYTKHADFEARIEAKVQEFWEHTTAKAERAIIKKLGDLADQIVNITDIEIQRSNVSDGGAFQIVGHWVFNLKDGKSGHITTENILAGGWNIQRLHVRYIVKCWVDNKLKFKVKKSKPSKFVRELIKQRLDAAKAIEDAKVAKIEAEAAQKLKKERNKPCVISQAKRHRGEARKAIKTYQPLLDYYMAAKAGDSHHHCGYDLSQEQLEGSRKHFTRLVNENKEWDVREEANIAQAKADHTNPDYYCKCKVKK